MALFFFCFRIAIGSGYAGESSPQISHAYPPPEDIRKPDRMLATSNLPPAYLGYNPDGRVLVSLGGDKFIRVWDARTGEQGTGQLLRQWEASTGMVYSAAFRGSNGLVSLGDDRIVKTWELSTGKLLHSWAAPFDLRIAFVRPGDGRPLVKFLDLTNHWEGVWDYEQGAQTGSENFPELQTVPSKAGMVADHGRVAFSDTRSVVGQRDGSLTLREGNGTNLIIKAHKAAVRAVAFSPKGEQVASASDDKTVKVWDVETGTLLCTMEGHTAPVISVAFNPNGQKMASCDVNGGIAYWTVPLPPIPPVDLEKIRAALPDKATAMPKKPRRILVFWRADAILHKGGVPAANHAIELMGRKTGAYQADFSRDYDALDPKVLAQYDAIVMNSTAHLAIPEKAKQALLDYARNGGGVVGIHAAIDTFRNWPEGAAIIGATFGNHPWHPSGTWAVRLEEPDHPLVRAWGGKNFKMHDEFYEMAEPYSRADRRVLLSVDLSDPATAGVSGLRRKDRDFALSWIKQFGKGRVFYCVFGHIGEPFQNPAVLKYYLDGIQYVLGDLELTAADAGPRLN